jgi:hypothetical protein
MRAPTGDLLQHAKSQQEEYLLQHAAFVQQLSNMVKVISCCLLSIGGIFYVACTVFKVPAHVSASTTAVLVAFTLFFFACVFAIYKGIWDTLEDWLEDLPLWEKAVGILKLDFSRGLILFCVLPYLPFVLLLSAMNKAVRACRGLAADPQATSLEERQQQQARDLEALGDDCSSKAQGRRCQWLTPRVAEQLQHLVHGGNVLGVVSWIFIFGFLLITLNSLASRLLQPFLAYLKHWFDIWNFSFMGIVGSTCVVGLVLFLLPPVPGAVVYVFCGMLFPRQCPGSHGFEIGIVVAILAGVVMKIVASIMQQKLIGESLGSQAWVQQFVGSNRPLMRTIEAVLRKPGLSPGKVAILVGGPDWPTSVLCGILKLPLLPIVIGTLPIIGFITPFALTGTMMAKASEGGEHAEMYRRWGALMTMLSLLVSGVLYVIMAWAFQGEIERDPEEFTRPREEDMELDWLDYRSAEIAKNCPVAWNVLPRAVKVVLATGLVLILGSSHYLLIFASTSFSEFGGANADVSNLKWFGDDGIVRPPGIIALCCALASGFCLTAFKCWRKAYLRERVERECERLSQEEEGWKARRLEQVHAWRATRATEQKRGALWLFGKEALQERAMMSAWKRYVKQVKEQKQKIGLHMSENDTGKLGTVMQIWRQIVLDQKESLAAEKTEGSDAEGHPVLLGAGRQVKSASFESILSI